MENKSVINAVEFWERLKQISKSRNITQKEYCAKLGIDDQQFRNKKTTGTIPTVEQLVKLSQFFGVSLNYMLTGSSTDDNENYLIEELETYKTKFAKLKEIFNDSASSLPSDA